MSELYMSAEQAASALGISVKSLYAYVSRKRIRTTAQEGSRARYYWAEDVLRLKRGERQLGPDSILVPTSAITQLGEGGPRYRGHSAVDMAATESFEATAAHLWGLPERDAFAHPAPGTPPTLKGAWSAMRGLPAAAQAIGLFPLIDHASPTSHDLSASGYARTGADIIRWFAAIMMGTVAPSTKPIHLQITARRADTRPYADLVRRILVLAADHELSPPTYAVRAAANTGVTPFQAVGVGLTAAQGRRLTGGRTYLIRRLVDEIVEARDAADLILRRFRDNEPLPGFGDGVYPATDPRAKAVLATLADSFQDMPGVPKLVAAVEAAQNLYGRSPDFLVPLALVEGLVGLHASPGSLSALGRIPGWIAHASEQYHAGSVIRIRTAYVGPANIGGTVE